MYLVKTESILTESLTAMYTKVLSAGPGFIMHLASYRAKKFVAALVMAMQ